MHIRILIEALSKTYTGTVRSVQASLDNKGKQVLTTTNTSILSKSSGSADHSAKTGISNSKKLRLYLVPILLSERLGPCVPTQEYGNEMKADSG